MHWSQQDIKSTFHATTIRMEALLNSLLAFLFG